MRWRSSHDRLDRRSCPCVSPGPRGTVNLPSRRLPDRCRSARPTRPELPWPPSSPNSLHPTGLSSGRPSLGFDGRSNLFVLNPDVPVVAVLNGTDATSAPPCRRTTPHADHPMTASWYHGPISISRHRDPSLTGCTIHGTLGRMRYDCRSRKNSQPRSIGPRAVMSQSGTGSSAWTNGAVASSDETLPQSNTVGRWGCRFADSWAEAFWRFGRVLPETALLG